MADFDVIAPMQAGVFRIHVVKGDAVAEGDTLITLESMKMEIPVSAPMAGTVTEVVASEGDTVDGGDVLMRVSDSG